MFFWLENHVFTRHFLINTYFKLWPQLAQYIIVYLYACQLPLQHLTVATAGIDGNGPKGSLNRTDPTGIKCLWSRNLSDSHQAGPNVPNPELGEWYPLVMTNSLPLKMAIEIVDFPMKNCHVQ